ncbi:MAG: type VI secretion system contractile sheath large subunit [Phycisphaerae bacterium]|nr:type VI secretion system contractile sheath large subunit [Phycisphaerae bacterium]
MADRPENYDLEVNLPMPHGLRVTAERPYHILVVGDLAGSDAGSLSGPLQDGIVEVKADTFDDVMAAACPTVSFTAADPLASKNEMVEISQRFDSLRAFQPKNLVERIPAVRPLMDAREQIVKRLLGKLSAAQFSEALAKIASSDSSTAWLTDSLKWSPLEPTADPAAADSVLDQLDLGDGEDTGASAPPPKSPIGSIVAAAAGQGASVPSEEVSTLRRTLAEIDRRVSVWLTAVLHSPHVQAIEAAWRSLAFLVSHTDFRKGVRLSLLHAPRAQLTERFTTLLIDPVFDEGADAPDLVVVDTQFGNTAADLETLDELAQHGASLPALVLAGVSAGFFGVKHAWQLPTLPTLSTMFDQWQFAKWKALRGQPHAQSLGAVFGRCLLREPHAQADGKDLQFAYREPCATDRDFVWAGGAIAVACAVSNSVAKTGWPTAMAGFVHGRVEGFTTAEGGKDGKKKIGPADTQLTQDKIEEMASVGINAALGIKDHDDILIWNGLTAARPKKMDTSSLLEVSLPYQLFAGRLSSLLFALKPHLSGMSPEKVVPFVREHVVSWLFPEGEPDSAHASEHVSVQTGPPEDDPSAVLLAVTVTPPRMILAGGIPVVLGYRLN